MPTLSTANIGSEFAPCHDEESAHRSRCRFTVSRSDEAFKKRLPIDQTVG
jgi:hypothetical protein